uniref:Uncharacterized protein n=1 Tax=Gopherus evgoodei TaxID=1825980 RepID=A0A8C4Y699_9SAUR
MVAAGLRRLFKGWGGRGSWSPGPLNSSRSHPLPQAGRLPRPDHCPLCLSVPCRLSNCYFTGVCCGALSAVLSKSQSLRKLDVCYNKLGDAGMKLLCDGLRQPDCKLQKLRLTGCGLTPACCEDLSVVITTNQSLTELNINHDALGDSGMKRLRDGLNSASCKLQMLL